MEHRNNVNLSLFIQLAKVKQQPQNGWKKKPGLSECGPWICNWSNKIVIFWSFFWDDFVVWFLRHLKNLNMLYSDKAFSQRLQKIFQPFTSIDIASSFSYKSFPTINKRFWLRAYMKTTTQELKLDWRISSALPF